MLSGCGEADDDVAAKYLFAGGGERVSGIPGIIRGPRGVVVSRHQEIRGELSCQECCGWEMVRVTWKERKLNLNDHVPQLPWELLTEFACSKPPAHFASRLSFNAKVMY